MKFVDLKAEYDMFSEEIDASLEGVKTSGHYLFGKQLEKLEKDFASYIGVKNAVGVKNCTDAIMILVKHLATSSNTPVIIPNFGAYPTSIACRNVTKNIFYVDVDRSMTMDPSKLPDVWDGIIIPVHLFGNNCDMEPIMEYARERNHVVIEDCAQSTGSGSGMAGDYSVFSFYPTKPLASMGDGGMICTNNDVEVFKKLRFYGQNNGKVEMIGVNSRMDEFQSAVVNAKLPGFEKLNDRRREICGRYLQIVKGIDWKDGAVFHQFPVLYENRDQIAKQMTKEGIPFIIHYPEHVSDMDPLRSDSHTVEYRVNDKIISFPCHPFMTEEEIQKVEDFLRRTRDQEI